MIKAEGLTMRYGPVLALDNVSFEVNTGEIVALLGPNGAGKSTTMKILTTYLHPTAGTARVNDFDVLENPLQARTQIGYLPETLPLYMDMEVRSYLRFVGKGRWFFGTFGRHNCYPWSAGGLWIMRRGACAGPCRRLFWPARPAILAPVRG